MSRLPGFRPRPVGTHGGGRGEEEVVTPSTSETYIWSPRSSQSTYRLRNRRINMDPENLKSGEDY